MRSGSDQGEPHCSTAAFGVALQLPYDFSHSNVSVLISWAMQCRMSLPIQT